MDERAGSCHKDPMKAFLWASRLLLIFLVTGCHYNQDSHPTETREEWAYQLIEEDKYEEAIELFWALMDQKDTPNIRMGLASAYAARAGVRVESYWDMVLPNKRFQIELPRSFKGTEQFKKDWDQFLKNVPTDYQTTLVRPTEEITKTFQNLETLQWRFRQIPLIETPQQANDISVARVLVTDLPSRGSHLYRALLTLILFRYEANQSAALLDTLAKQAETPLCNNPLQQWLNHLPIPLDLVSEFLEDVKVAFPKKQNDFQTFEREFAKIRSQLDQSHHLLEGIVCKRN